MSDAAGGKTRTSLEELIRQAANPVEMLRRNPMRPFVFPVVPLEFTNWQDEQRSFRESVALTILSYHMTELHLRGRGALEFVKQFVVNKLDPFPVERAKQMVAVAPDGNIIGDAILFRESEDFLRLVGGPAALDWLNFQAQSSSHELTAQIEPSSMVRAGARDVFRIQVQGPHALELVREVSRGTLPEIKFFHIGNLTIAGHNVRALRHSMAGMPGFEIYGPWEAQQPIVEAFEAAGSKYGLRKVGMKAGPVLTIEGGWLPIPLPAIYEHEDLKAYREWLTASDFEAVASLGGSFKSQSIADYYVDPFEAGYGSFIDFNRDFLGRDALIERSKSQQRKKVTLVWNTDDVLAVMRSVFTGEKPGRMPEIPSATFATFIADRVERNGELVGLSRHQYGFSANVKSFISLAIVDIGSSEPGTEVKLLWGEADAANAIPPQHQIHEIRATVAPVPYFEYVNKTRA